MCVGGGGGGGHLYFSMLCSTPLSSRLKLTWGVESPDQGLHLKSVSTVVIAWHTYKTIFEPNIIKSKSNITKSESFITIFRFLY